MNKYSTRIFYHCVWAYIAIIQFINSEIKYFGSVQQTSLKDAYKIVIYLSTFNNYLSISGI